MMTSDQVTYGNTYERTVIGHEPIDPAEYAREITRYRFAGRHITPGRRVLELGCSSGFGTRFFIDAIYYTGVDYSADIVRYATEKFGSDHHRFVCATIDEFLATNTDHYDVIIAFEILEHLPNGKELAQTLKQRCDTLILSTPFREPPGFWGKYHVLHNLQESDFPDFAYHYIHDTGTLSKRPNLTNPANLLLMLWQRGQTYPARQRILCAVPTRNRYDVLMNCLQSIAFQSAPPDKVVIYDDSGEHERIDIREHPVGRYILPILHKHGIEWEVMFMPGQGQHLAHEAANLSGYDFVWRIDDDCVAEPDVLARLLAYMRDEKVGAAAGAVYEVNRLVSDGGTSTLKDFFHKGNVQWAPDHGVFPDVDFLYSSFLYRPGIVHYKLNMSPAAFHEETIFTHRLKRAGYQLIADTTIHTHHFKAPDGGTRAVGLQWAYAWDQQEFTNICANEWGVKFIRLAVGLGDCLAFKNILPELKQKYRLIVLSAAYPEVFENEPQVIVIPYDNDMTTHGNIYEWMAERNWTGTLRDAFRGMYL